MLTADIYDAIYSYKDYEAEAISFLQIAEETLGRPPDSLLDMGCGTGKHLELFARRVPVVAGVEINPTYLDKARRLLPDLRLEQGDIRTANLNQTFDVVTCLFAVIGYMTTTEQLQKAITNMARHLNPGGLLIVEPWLEPDAVRPPKLDVAQVTAGEMTVTRHSRLEKVSPNTSRMEFHYLCGTAQEIRYHFEVLDHGLFTRGELMEAARGAGLTPVYDASAGPSQRGLLLAGR